MKKGKRKWLSLPLMLMTATALMSIVFMSMVSCSGGDTSVPAETSIKFDGKDVYCQMGTALGEDWQTFDLDWNNENQNKINKFVITIGSDVLNGQKPKYLVFLIGVGENPTISKADYTALVNKLNAALPNNSGKKFEELPKQYQSETNFVDNYAQ
jgi:hypothetical protein